MRTRREWQVAMAHVCLVARNNESSHMNVHVSHINESCHTYALSRHSPAPRHVWCHTYEWGMSHPTMSQVTWMFMSHIWMNHVTGMPCPATHLHCAKFHATHISRVAHMNEACQNRIRCSDGTYMPRRTAHLYCAMSHVTCISHVARGSDVAMAHVCMAYPAAYPAA